MDGKTTVRYLQSYIRRKDYEPDQMDHYVRKLTEETEELIYAIRKGSRPGANGGIKGTIDEELWDVMYYLLAIANCYGIDMETAIREKEKLNQRKYGTPFAFEEGR